MVSIKIISILTIIICLLQLAAYSFLFALKEFSPNDAGVLNFMQIIIEEEDKFFYTIVVSFALNGVWFITSICLTHFASKGISQHLKIIGIIWIVFAILNCICDVVFIGLFADDIINNDTLTNLLSAYISLLVICARGIILLILNFCTTIVMLISITRLSNDLQNGLKTRTVPLKPPKSVLKQTKETHLEEENVPRVKDWYNHYEQPKGKDDNEPPPEKTDIIRRFIPRIRNFRGNDPVPFNKAQNNNQNSHTTGIPGSNTNVMINGVPSGTLRRQLPWSYMPNLNKPRAPPVPPPKPHVPVPDYSYLHQPQPQPRRDLQEQNWSQYM